MYNDFFVESSKAKSRSLRGPKIKLGTTIGFFYGVVEGGVGGCGAILKLNDDQHFNFMLGCGSTTNTKANLLTLWIFLVFSWLIGIGSLHIFGDSLAIISWSKGVHLISILYP